MYLLLSIDRASNIKYNKITFGISPDNSVLFSERSHKTMKKVRLLSLLMAILMLFPMAVGCNGGEPQDTTVPSTTASPEDDSEPATDPSTDDSVETDPSTEETDTTTANQNENKNPEEDKTLDILFLGNSLMYYNDMPGIFRNLARAAGKDVYVDSVTKGSATMSQFASAETEIGQRMRTLLSSRTWDIVIIEPSRRISPYETTVFEAELESAKTLQKLARSAGAEIMLYSVWGNNTGSLTIYTANTPLDMPASGTQAISHGAHTRFMHETNLKVAEALGGAKIIEAGYAFENLRAANSTINLYDPDERHPSAEGSYLAACTVFATIFGEKTENISYTFDLNTSSALKKAADDTVIEKVVPTLPEIPARTDSDFNLLVIGSNLMDNHDMFGVLSKLVSAADGKAVNTTTLLDGSFVCNMLTKDSTDLGMREALAEKEWDAIIIQLTRRCTPSSPDVAASELAALKSVWSLLAAETDKIYIMTLEGSKNPAIFTTSGGALNYTKTGNTESLTAAETTAYFENLVKEFSTELGCDTILYGNAYIEGGTTAKKNVGYLQAVCAYAKLFGKALPSDCSETNGLSADVAASLRAIAEKHCLKSN